MKIRNYKLMAGVAFAALVGIVSIQSNNVSELIKSATAKQALNGSANKPVINKSNLIAFSPDGSRVALLDQGGAITVKDVVTSQTLWFHFDPSNTTVAGLLFSPGGKTLASYGENTVNLWNTENGQEKGSIPLKETSTAIVQLVFSPDGKRMVGANQEQELLLWNLESGSSKPKVLGQGINFQEIKFSPDSQFLVAGTSGKKSKIMVWDSKAARLFKEFSTNETISEIVFSSDSKALAWIDQAGQIKVVDAISGNLKRIIETKEELASLAFNPVNNVLAVGSKGNDPKFQLWNTDTGELILSRKTEGLAAVTKLLFNKAGTLLVSVGSDNKISVWNLPNGDLQQLLSGHGGSISKAVFNTTKQDTLAAVGENGQIIVWNSATGFIQQDFQVPVWSPALLSSQQSMVANSGASSQPTSAGLSNTNVNAPIASATKSQTVSRGKKVKNRSVKKWKGINALAFNADGTEMGAGDAEGTIRVFKKNGNLRWKMSGHHGKAITGVGYRKKSSQWISIGADTEIKVWDNKTGNVLKTFYGPEHPPKTVAVSSDDRLLAVAGEDTRIFLYDVSEGKLKQIFYGSADFVNGLAFSPDGKILASGGSDGKVLLWEISSGKLLESLSGHTDEVNSVSISPDGGLIASASADSTVILWNLHDGQKFKVLTGHQGAVRSVSFSPNGKKLVSAGDDSKMLVWNPANGQLRKRMVGSVGAVNSVVFDPSGNLHSGNENGEISGFDTESGDKLETINVPVSSGPKPQALHKDTLYPKLQASNSVAINSRIGDEGLRNENQNLSQSLVGLVANKILDWLIPVAKADPNQGPGGPILIITPTTTSSYGHYYAEILRNEGLNEFAVAAIGSVNATMLNGYDVVILSQMTLTPTQVTMFNTWVNSGGNLIAMRPDTQLASLLGLTYAGSTLQNGYLLVNTSAAPGNGIVGETIQYHGFADLYTLNGSSAIATLYSNATTATTSPAVTLRSVGSAGGQAAAFTYDLARSVIYTRQGNPAWIGQNRDRGVSSVAAAVIRSNDLYYGADPVDNQPDWIDFNKLAIPQADEQQRLLANLIGFMNLDKKPLPRFWYFPAGVTSAVLMTGDDHANGGTIGLFNSFIAQSPSGCSVQNWECYRYTSYAYTNVPMTQTQAVAYNNQGFEVGLHINTGCSDYTPASLQANYAQQVADFNTKFSNALAPVTMRHHCLVWSDWATGVKTQINHGIRLDTSYYFWPPSWVLDRPGLFTGSAMPMRFADADGSLIDAYQATSQMTDESGQSYPITIDSLLNKAVGAEGYYGVYNVNAHTDLPSNPVADSVLAAAVSRGVPVISSRQLLNWLDFRNNSSFSGMSWSGNTLSFTVTPGSVSTSAPEGVPSNRLQVLLPKKSSNGILASLTRNGNPKSYSNITIKGVDYAAISDNTSGVSGAYVATYAADTTPPTVLSRTPVAGATGVILSASVSATFSEAIDPATITASTFQLVGPGSTVVPSQVTYNSNTLTATITPSSALIANTLYTATVKGGSTAPQIKDLAGNSLSANVTWSFTTEAQPCSSSSCSAWPPTAVPATPSVNDPGAVELGVKFRTDITGYVTGVRFYKGATNTGTHTGNLWSSTGTRLATAIFTGETGSGWQQVNFSAPVQIDPNTTYVASYHAPNGNYALSNSPEFLSQGVDNGPVHLLRNGIDGGNGVYAYGTSSSFPQSTFQGSNYWVDVVFTTTAGPDTTAPTVTSQNPAAGMTGVATNSAITATFSEPMNAATITGTTFELRNTATNGLVTATVSYDSVSRTATLTPNASLTASTQYTATIRGGATEPRVKDLAGLAMAADFNWNFTTAAAGTPSCASATSIWSSNPTPATLQDPDTNPVELGVKFRSNVNGYICGIRFYKGVNNTGTHVGKLWNITGGNPLATATFTNETASGWQQVSFASPVQITANTVYVASYYAPNGRYSTNNNYFTAGITNGSLYALADGESGGNGVYGYISGGGFPANTFQKENYWVDVLFTTNIGPDTTQPTVSSTLPTTNATGVATTDPITITFSESMDIATISASTIELRNTSTNALVAATVSYNSASRTATLTPSASLTASTQYTALVRGGTTDPRVKDLAGLALATNYTWNFTTGAAGATGCSAGTSTIWPGTTVPAVIGNADPASVELGVKFRTTQNGYICGIRFYKDSTNTGTHVGNLWNAATGANLATVTFTGETGSGWQQMNFSTPVQIVANVTYVASYLAPVGRYSINNNFFATGVTSGPLYAFGSAESGGNGVYAYGNGGTMPSNTFQASNYWVDVAFTNNIGPDTTLPTVLQTLPSPNASGVIPANPITVTFSEPMDPATINGTSNIELRGPANSLVAATLSYNSATNTATLTPSSVLAVSTQYTARVKAGTVKDIAQNALGADYTWQFTTGADPCSVGGNPIVCENALPGNPSSEWDISGAGDLSIQGFATDISVNRGQTVNFKIDTPSNDYRLDIYRMGYYSGAGARKVTTVQPTAFPIQPACLTNSTGLVDCGNWSVTASWTVPANAVSGVYFAKVIREDGGNTGASHIVFIVRDDASTSDILFQTADTTWQAYNNYGGNNLYGGSGPGGGISGNGRAYKVSYNRPFYTRNVDNGQDWVFNAEYPMIRWLEANGYNVSYFTGVDSDRFGSLIRNHKLFMSNAHDEYWSGQQRANVEAARDASTNPVNLAFFSGNEIYWKTRWENSISAPGTAYRTLVCYKETHQFAANGSIDPSSEWTGTWRDPRGTPPADGGRPENELIGTIFTVNAGATTSITVPEADGKMRFWRNTSVANLASGSTATLPFATLGYEWDEDLDNGFRPAGLVRLSTTIVPNAPVLTDYGSTFGSGIANHALTLYKATSGAIVFGSGTVQWAWGLDSNHDLGNTPPSPAMQQATVNLFADMGVQPGTIQPGLTQATPSIDASAPSSVITSPTAGANVQPGTLVIVSGTASDIGGRVGGVEVSVDGGSTWHPATGRATWTYSWNTPATNGPANIRVRAVDDSLNMENPGSGINITVGAGGDTTPPTNPSNLVALQTSGTQVNLTWTASIDASGVAGYRVERCSGSTTCTNFAEIAAPTVAPFLNAGLTEGTIYRYRVRAIDNSGIFSTAYSNIVTIRPDATAPGAPTGLSAAVISDTQINLSWTAPTDNVAVTGYRIERCANAGCTGFAEIGTSTSTSFSSTGLTAGTSYSFRVRANDAIPNLSGYSNTVTAIPQIQNLPVAVTDTFLYVANVTRTVNAPGVLVNDTDPLSRPLSAQFVTGSLVNGGTLNFSTNGSFNYLRTTGATTSFSYRAIAGGALSLPTIGATVNMLVDAPPTTVADNCTYDRSANTVTQPTRCTVLAARQVRMNVALNDTDSNTATNIPTDGVGRTAVPATVVITGVTSAGVTVSANAACGQGAIGLLSTSATIQNNCDGTITVNMTAINLSNIVFSYTIKDDLGATSSARSVTLSSVA